MRGSGVRSAPTTPVLGDGGRARNPLRRRRPHSDAGGGFHLQGGSAACARFRFVVAALDCRFFHAFFDWIHWFQYTFRGVFVGLSLLLPLGSKEQILGMEINGKNKKTMLQENIARIGSDSVFYVSIKQVSEGP